MKKAFGLKRCLLMAMMLLWVQSGSAVAAVYETEPFDNGWTLASSSWTEYQNLPNTVDAVEFEGDYRLHFGFPSDSSAAFLYSFQGIQHEVTMPEVNRQSFEVDLYIGSDWATTACQVGMSGKSWSADGSTSSLPTLVFRNDGSSPAGIYSYNYRFPFYTLEKAASDVTLGAWHTLRFDIVQGVGVEYFFDDEFLGIFADPAVYDLSTVMLNTSHNGIAQDIYFDNFRAVATPVPAAVWLLGSGLAGLIGLRRRMRANLSNDWK